MAKGDKYIGLTKYLQGSGSDTVELTFSQIGDIVGGLPPAAYRHRAYWSDGSQGSFSYGWLNAGYSLRVQFKDQIAIFTKSDRKPSAMTASSLKKPSIRADSAEKSCQKANLISAPQSTQYTHITYQEGMPDTPDTHHGIIVILLLCHVRKIPTMSILNIYVSIWRGIWQAGACYAILFDES